MLPEFMRPLLEIELPSQGSLFSQLASTFQLEEKGMPNMIVRQPHLYGQVQLLMALYCSPKDNKYLHLGLYNSQEDIGKVNGAELQRGLAEIRW